ncbi:MAG TPA: hypothetical protein VGL18_09625, partial [Actinomycetota bacterium]
TVTANVKDDEGSTASGQDQATVSVKDVAPTIVVTKDASPTSVTEPGGTVTFSLSVKNTSVSSDPVTLDSLVDDSYGDLDGKGSCSTGGTILPGATYSCSFTATVSGNAGSIHTDEVTAEVTDDDGSTAQGADDATVTVTNATPTILVSKTASPTSVPEPGATVSFTVDVYNASVSTDPVTLDSLVDDAYGDLDGQGSCSVPQTIASGATYSCTFTGAVSGNAGSTHTNTVTGTGRDDENTPASDDGSATVTVTNVDPSITVTKTASPTSVDEPGGSVTFTVEVKNTSVATDPVTLTSLTDSIHGDLNGQGSCATGGTINPGATYTCSFTATVSGNAGDSETDTVTANVKDDEGSTASGQDQATVSVKDVAPTIVVTKDASPNVVDEPGGMVTFTVKVTNTSVSSDPVTLDSLTDSVYGDLNGQGSCATGGTITPGATYTCSFTGTVSGNAGSSHTDKVTATVRDDENTPASNSAQATVTVRDVAPAVQVSKTAFPSSLAEPGGPVTFTVKVTNASVASTDPLTLTSLVDDVYGNLNGQGTCATPQTIPYGGSYTCSFTKTVAGNAGFSQTDKVTGTAHDDENNQVSDTGTATVTVSNATPTITVAKDASPASVNEPGGAVTFTVQVKNTSVSTDPVTLTSLTDSIHGDLNGQGSCATGGTINPGATYSCSFSATVSGNAGASETDVVTANVKDDESTPASGQDDATVTVANSTPTIQVTKSASPSTSPEPVGDVTFTVTVKNTSVSTDPVKLDSLIDNIYGDLNGTGTCATGGTINPGATYSCSFTVDFTGNPAGSYKDTVTAKASDDENTVAQGSADATVTVTRPRMSISKTVDKPTAAIGDELAYTISYSNSGDATAYNAVIVDTLPSQVTYKAGSATGPAGTTIEYSPNGSNWYSTEAGAGGAAAVRYIRWTIPTTAAGGSGSVGFKATINYPTGAGTAITNSATLTSYCSRAGDLERCYQGNTSQATTNVVALQIGSTSTMTNSAFQLVDDLSPWTINDFEILMNPKYVIIATNPGQFYYHQRGTVPLQFTGNTSWEFRLSWPSEFVPQTEGGQPIHAYIQYANDAPNTWRDWTPQSSSICWNSAQNTCSGADGTITVNNVPPGAKVWVTVHLDYALKGQTKDANFLKTPKLYTPFQSDILIKDQSSGAVVGASSSNTSLLGRGKKVTTVYGTMRDSAGNGLGGVWVQISQNGKTALAQTSPEGFYIFYDGQNCLNADGLAGGCSSGSTWTFAGGSMNATLTPYGRGPACDDPTCPPASGSPAYPSGYTKATITSGQVNYGTLNAPAGYSLSVAYGSAYNRDWKFTT